jgi:hypothetical protein
MQIEVVRAAITALRTRKLHPPPNDAWTPDPAADDEFNDPVATDESATNDHNTTDESGDPDPPHDKAA